MTNGAEIQTFTTERQPAFRSDVFQGSDGAQLSFPTLVETLVGALGQDRLIAWIIRGARDRARALEACFQKLTNDALTCDGVLASVDGGGVALVIQPDDEGVTAPISMMVLAGLPQPAGLDTGRGALGILVL